MSRRWSVVVGLSGLLLASALVGLTPGVGQASLSAPRERAAGGASIELRLGLSPAEHLLKKYAVRDEDGTVHTRYDRTYDGKPVIGGDLVVHRAPGGKIGSIDWASEADLSALRDLTPSVSKADAAAVARRTTNLPSSAEDAELVVYAIGDRARLAWESTASRGLGHREVVYVNASTGDRIGGWSLVEHADGTGNSLYSGTVTIQTVPQAGGFGLRDETRGNNRTLDNDNAGDFPPTGALLTDTDNVWGNGLAGNRQSAAVDAHYGAAKTWDYYLSRFNRNGIGDDGVGAPSFVHYGSNYENAFWDDGCFCMAYGDGGPTFRPLVSLDVAGHEMSHGVMSRTADLIYQGESGGLNEANSDIHGTMVEFFANNSNDKGDYYIGEKVTKVNPRFLRRMDNPRLDAPLHTGGLHGYNCWTPTMGADDVHFSSGPANHWFYLLAEGSGSKRIGGRAHNSPTCNGSTITGIGKVPASRIWYRAVTVYMTSTTDYKDARDATIRAARDLFGANSTQCQGVVGAWNAVRVARQDWTCSGTPPGQGTNAVTNPGFESGSTGWTVTGTLITNSTLWFPHSGSRYAWMQGYGSNTDDSLRQSVTVPNSPNAKLRFDLLVNTEEASGGSAFDTLQVRLGSATLGTFSNLNATDSYTRRTFGIGSFAGQTRQLQFIGNEDASIQTTFLVDDVRVTAD